MEYQGPPFTPHKVGNQHWLLLVQVSAKWSSLATSVLNERKQAGKLIQWPTAKNPTSSMTQSLGTSHFCFRKVPRLFSLYLTRSVPVRSGISSSRRRQACHVCPITLQMNSFVKFTEFQESETYRFFCCLGQCTIFKPRGGGGCQRSANHSRSKDQLTPLE